MDEATLQKVCRLAPALRQSAHLLLHHHHCLSLDTATLREIQDAFGLILEMEQHTNFHVLPPNHRQHPAIPHLQMVYDLLQKVAGLRLWAKEEPSHPAREVVSLRCFRSLRTLEVCHIPVHQLKALQTLRPSLRRVMVTRGLTAPQDLFLRCGADKTGEFVWEQLQEAILSHNTMRTLDNSLRLLPNLKVLDVSFCELEDASALEYLPSLTFLDISHNRLTDLPRLAARASPSLVVLIASYNHITTLAGLQLLTGLEEVDVGDNLISGHGSLVTLAALARLRSLNLGGNPAACHPHHRRRTVLMMHPATPVTQVTLDGSPLTQQEKQLIGSVSSPPDLPHTLPISPYTPQASQPSTAQQENLTQALPQQEVLSRSAPGRRSKKHRTRQITLGDPEEGEVVDVSPQHPNSSPPIVFTTSDSTLSPDGMGAPPAPPPPSLALGAAFPVTTTSTTVVTTTADTVVQAFATLSLTHHTALRTPAPEQSDRLLEEILQSKTDTPASPPQPPPPAPPLPPPPAPQDTSPAPHDTSPVPSEEHPDTSKESGDAATGDMDSSFESSFYKGGAALASPDMGSSISTQQSMGEEEEEEEEEGACLILAQREEVKEEEEQEEEEEEEEEGKAGEKLKKRKKGVVISDVILSITSKEFKEKHAFIKHTLYRWDLRCVVSVEVVSTSPEHRIVITFDTTRPAYKTRTYTLDTLDLQTLQKVLAPVLERNALQEMLQSAMTCLRCSAQFSRDVALPPPGKSHLQCPNCGGGVVVCTESVDHPAITTATTTTTATSNHLQQPQPVTSTPSTTTQYPYRRRCYPVLPPPPDDDDDFDQGPPAAQFHTPAAPSQDPQSLSMQESSSSGSMTGSVCTAYEAGRGGGGSGGGVGVGPPSLPTSPIKAPPQPLQPQQQDTEMVVESVQEDTTDAACDANTSLYFTAEDSMVSVASKTPHQSLLTTQNNTAHHLTFPSSGSSNGTLRRDEEVEVEEEEEEEERGGGVVSISSWVQSLLHTLTGYYWRWWDEVEGEAGMEGKSGGLHRPHNPFQFSYDDFSEVDHRLKLYLEVVLLQEPEEELLGVLKAVVVVAGGRREFQGVLVVSSAKIYVLEITGPEDDSPKTWLEEVLRGELTGVKEVYSLYQRQGVALALSDTLLLFSLADSHRANCFFNFLIETLDDHDVSPTLIESSPHQEAALTSLLARTVGSIGGMEGLEEESAPPALLAIVSLLLDGGCSESQYLVISDSDLVLYQADLTWYLPPQPDAPPTTTELTLTQAQKISNITAIEVHSASHLSLHFHDELTDQESSWGLHVTSHLTACHIIEAVRTPWTQLFSVDLQVTDTTTAAHHHTPHTSSSSSSSGGVTEG